MSQRRVLQVGIVSLGMASLLWAQISPEEAQRRLNSRLSTRPASTQPISDIDRLRAENRRLREENLSLQTEIAQLRDALAKATPDSTTAPSTRPSAGLTQSQLVGKWAGGMVTAGNAFTLEFNDDGSYRQVWTVGAAHADSGHWNAISERIIEMWTGNSQPRKPNQWQVDFDGETKVTLTPTLLDGAELAHGKPLTLKKLPS